MTIQPGRKTLITFNDQNYQLSESLISLLACRLSAMNRPTDDGRMNKWKKESKDEQPNDRLADRPSDQMTNCLADQPLTQSPITTNTPTCLLTCWPTD